MNYDICSDLFEIDTDKLDLWEFENNFSYWSQPDIKLNIILQNGNAKHVVNPLILPEIETIQKGIIFGNGLVGRQAQIKIHNRWTNGEFTAYEGAQDGNEELDDSKNAYSFVSFRNNREVTVNVKQLLLQGALRMENSKHVLGRLTECLNAAFIAPTVPAQAARSMPARV